RLLGGVSRLLLLDSRWLSAYGRRVLSDGSPILIIPDLPCLQGDDAVEQAAWTKLAERGPTAEGRGKSKSRGRGRIRPASALGRLRPFRPRRLASLDFAALRESPFDPLRRLGRSSPQNVHPEATTTVLIPRTSTTFAAKTAR